jgi:hypothetical protein
MINLLQIGTPGPSARHTLIIIAILMAGSRTGRAPHCSLAHIEVHPVVCDFIPVQPAPFDTAVDTWLEYLSLT